jgi:hypothetical protein
MQVLSPASRRRFGPGSIFTKSIYSNPASALEPLCGYDDVDALTRESAMLDAAYIVAGIAFFVISAFYALVCDRL